MISDIRSMLRFLGNTSVNHCSRDSNDVADCLAKKGSTMEGEHVDWREFWFSFCCLFCFAGVSSVSETLQTKQSTTQHQPQWLKDTKQSSIKENGAKQKQSSTSSPKKQQR
ncbi:hypothetical protein Dsin_012269 [Dipteronia sinensis]|uniref:Uncharacterized protein n=1 Tax=Dipteronia sinensis TaxID=43782 RepID=A0AAE0AJ14_9ROSI|nr:hypothetical protein Dsin_012269 [Dipteronia sinensis]